MRSERGKRERGKKGRGERRVESLSEGRRPRRDSNALGKVTTPNSKKGGRARYASSYTVAGKKKNVRRRTRR